jgi:hypothetical protein
MSEGESKRVPDTPPVFREVSTFDAPGREHPARSKPQPPTRRRTPPLPQAVRKEIAALALSLKRDYRALFASDPIYRKRAGQFLTALLPPKPRRRGRPGIQSVTQAIRLRRQLRRRFPNEPWANIWERIYPKAIPGYDTMSEFGQADARQELRERVRWRQRAKQKKPDRQRTPRIGS